MAVGDGDQVNYAHYTDRLKKPDVLSELKSADNKFLFARALLIEHGMLPTTLDRPADSGGVRPVTEQWKTDFEHGLVLSGTGQYKEAAKQFSRSMVDGEPGTDNHALAMTNRAVALYHLGQFTRSLMDVRQALKSKYPPEMGPELYKFAGKLYKTLGRRKEAEQSYAECLRRLDESGMTAEAKRKFRLEVAVAVDKCKDCNHAESDLDISDDSDLENPFLNKLVGGKNKNIPALSAFLELKSSKNMGRGVYATRDINPGDVVAIDEPYIYGGLLLHKSCCHNCQKSPIAPIPCRRCSLVYYCSENCLHKSMKDGHNLECPIIFFVRSLPGITDLYQLALKWLLKDVSKMGLKKFCLLVDTFSKSKIDPKTRGFNENGQYKSDNFLTAYSLDSSEEEMPIDVLFFFNCIAAEMLQYLMLSGFKIEECYLGIVGTSLVRILSVLDLNARKINTNAPNMASLKGQLLQNYYYLTFPMAIALYPSLALFNHSCDPNIERSGKLSTKTRVIKAIQPILKGNQLFFNYGRSILFDKMKKEKRQEICRDNFKFECCCQPCIENWPQYDSIPNGLSAKNILNPSMADTVIKECKLFEEFIEKVGYDEFHLHLNYLYGFIKLLFTNVKRPFGLYHKCLRIIIHVHTELKHPIIF
ncbi:SET and MYND domain-containing protein 4-like [Metopolophium dirhodum]|uniref:SET and MYND domain-containing protein 4-like n=1 Tax=Metopolophium dirhodum TaxID=44670 RepID=UPI00298F45F9|nr:SET and MYND domain-containing protein 4-like [Metopolophium dirhodum]